MGLNGIRYSSAELSTKNALSVPHPRCPAGPRTLEFLGAHTVALTWPGALLKSAAPLQQRFFPAGEGPCRRRMDLTP